MVSLAVIFDFDGVILDSETPEYEAHRSIFEEHGLDLTIEEWCERVGLWPSDSAGWFDRLSARSGRPPDRAAFLADTSRRFNELVRMVPMPGVRNLLDELSGAGVPLAIASAAPDRWVGRAIDAIGIRSYFQAIVTGNEVSRVKPAPDVYLEAARRLDVRPHRAIAVEDSSPGLAAAKAAGMRTIVIPHPLTERHDLSAADLRVRHAGQVTLEVLHALVAQG